MSESKESSSVKVVVIGATGVVGSAVVAALEAKGGCDIIKASRKSEEAKVDAMDEESVKALFEKLGKVDHVVSCIGSGHFGPVASMTSKDVMTSINGKFMSQCSISLIAKDYLNPGGSIVLTSGILDREPVPLASSISAANAALRGWVTAAATELKNDTRINLVSPGLVAESVPMYGPYFVGIEGVPAAKVAQKYLRAMFGGLTGKTLEVFA